MEPGAEDIVRHLTALWCETFGEPPPVTADAETLSRILIEHLNAAPPYRPRPPGGQPTVGTRNP